MNNHSQRWDDRRNFNYLQILIKTKRIYLDRH